MQIEIWTDYVVTYIKKNSYKDSYYTKITKDSGSTLACGPHYEFERAFSTFKSRREARDFISAQIKYWKQYHKVWRERCTRKAYRIDHEWHFSFRKYHCSMLPDFWKNKKSRFYEVPETYKGLDVVKQMLDVHND